MRVVRAKTVWRVLAGAAALCIHTGRFISRNPAFMLPRQMRCKVVGRFETSCIGVTLLRPCTLAKACRGGSLIPAWTLLERRSIAALLTPEPRLPNAIQVSSAVSPDEIAAAPIMRAIRLMVERVVASDGLMLTARGSLTRADISALFEAMDWPDYDKDSVLAVNKVLNEADVLPIQFTRIVAQETKLLRPRKGRLLATKRVRDLLSPERAATSSARCWRRHSGASTLATSTASPSSIGRKPTSAWSYGPSQLLPTGGPNRRRYSRLARCRMRVLLVRQRMFQGSRW